MKAGQSPRPMKVLAVGATHSRELKPFIATVRRSHHDFQSNGGADVCELKVVLQGIADLFGISPADMGNTAPRRAIKILVARCAKNKFVTACLAIIAQACFCRVIHGFIIREPKYINKIFFYYM